jgi:hypothetical protein
VGIDEVFLFSFLLGRVFGGLWVYEISVDGLMKPVAGGIVFFDGMEI